MESCCNCSAAQSLPLVTGRVTGHVHMVCYLSYLVFKPDQCKVLLVALALNMWERRGANAQLCLSLSKQSWLRVSLTGGARLRTWLRRASEKGGGGGGGWKAATFFSIHGCCAARALRTCKAASGLVNNL